jgi:hypothetical protein
MPKRRNIFKDLKNVNCGKIRILIIKYPAATLNMG